MHKQSVNSENISQTCDKSYVLSDIAYIQTFDRFNHITILLCLVIMELIELLTYNRKS